MPQVTAAEGSRTARQKSRKPSISSKIGTRTSTASWGQTPTSPLSQLILFASSPPGRRRAGSGSPSDSRPSKYRQVYTSKGEQLQPDMHLLGGEELNSSARPGTGSAVWSGLGAGSPVSPSVTVAASAVLQRGPVLSPALSQDLRRGLGQPV